ncbi:MAG: DNA mismatch repair endonuclease MutL [Bacteroidota bacterium]
MSDRIRLLSDAVANQIAAGEVVQRPASAVKEMLENSLDAGATDIRLVIEDGGTRLIQVIDNGQGMSPIDARMCFERHATSKINRAEDLFALRSFGFRGEALASIAAVAQVEMRTRREEDEAATLIRIEGSRIIAQEFAAAPVGTNIAVKNLFFNIPARRNFLKSQAVETKHVIEEFCRLALAWPDRRFTLFQNNNEVYRLEPGSLEKRVSEILDRRKPEDFLRVQESTDWMEVSGFVGKPETARKTRGEQYFFVNQRFIRNSYLNHAVQTAYEGLLAAESFPPFVLFITIDPAKVDVNVHPTKTEVKFEDERALYSIIRAAVKHALGLYNLVPLQQQLQHEGLGGLEDTLRQTPPERFAPPPVPGSDSKRNFYNPFGSDSGWAKPRFEQSNWQKAFETPDEAALSSLPEQPQLPLATPATRSEPDAFLMLGQGLTAFRLEGVLHVADNARAHERVLYEYFLREGRNEAVPSQQLLFPRTLEMKPADMALIEELMPELQRMGIDLAVFGNNTIIVNGLPADHFKGNEKELIEGLMEQFNNQRDVLGTGARERAALAMARQQAYRKPSRQEPEETQDLLQRLFRCSQPAYTPGGKPVYLPISAEWLGQQLKRN